MDIFSLYNSLPGLANVAGQAWNAGVGAVQDAFTPEEEDAQERRRNAVQARAQAQQRQRKAAAKGAGGMNPVSQGFVNMFGPGAQARNLQGKANMTMKAMDKENDARRSSFREARRLAHERDMLLLRLQAEREMRDRK